MNKALSITRETIHNSIFIYSILLRALYICILHTTEGSVYLYTPYYWELCISVHSILLKALYICILHTTRALYICILHTTESSVYINILHTTDSSVYMCTPYYWEFCKSVYSIQSSSHLNTPYYWKLCISVYSILLKALYIHILYVQDRGGAGANKVYWRCYFNAVSCF